MSSNSQPQIQKLRLPIKNGQLDLVVELVDVEGSRRPFIVRTVSLGCSQHSTKTVQHTLIKSLSELESWVSQDEFIVQFPEAFAQLKHFCKAVLS